MQQKIVSRGESGAGGDSFSHTKLCHKKIFKNSIFLFKKKKKMGPCLLFSEVSPFFAHFFLLLFGAFFSPLFHSHPLPPPPSISQITSNLGKPSLLLPSPPLISYQGTTADERAPPIPPPNKKFAEISHISRPRKGLGKGGSPLERISRPNGAGTSLMSFSSIRPPSISR